MTTIAQEVSLKPYNTFGIDVTARHLAKVETVANLQQLTTEAWFQQVPKIVVGGGSNLLFTKNYDGLILLNCLKGKNVIQETAQTVYLRLASGENWHESVLYAVQNGWGGIENLSLIPGSVGAAPIQNIGAYGVELKDVMHDLQAIDLKTGEIVVFSAKDCKFAYRDSIFKHSHKAKYFIISVTLRLDKIPVPNVKYGAIAKKLQEKNYEANIANISQVVCEIRQQKLPNPAEIGNCGSFFKNPIIEKAALRRLQASYPKIPYYPLPLHTPEKNTQVNTPKVEKVKLSAGWLIEKCGWKGKKIGNTGTYEKHALVLVNHGHATGQEVAQLAHDIQVSVMAQFQISIAPEVNII